MISPRLNGTCIGPGAKLTKTIDILCRIDCIIPYEYMYIEINT